ncbi:hypothetical protein TA3x_000529 [Tundrisphaera sp. TA3]|uniref:hypothetical protein n=1 Tax=Tundrisphaera sp. TA3 TaxID=3435775 RepID=UPI003EB7BB89
MPVWTFDQATYSYALRIEDGVYYLAQSDDGTWRAFFVPDELGHRHETDQEGLKAVEDYLARRP